MTVKILFVCLGNICRSPAAEGVFKSLLKREGLDSKFLIESAGTSGFHSGQLPDKRMRKHALKRDIVLDSYSRKINVQDLEAFDHVIVMDDKNHQDVLALSNVNNEQKIKKLTDYCTTFDVDHVLDPYYGGAAGFEKVLDILEDACSNLLLQIKKERSL